MLSQWLTSLPQHLDEIHDLLKLLGENPFKIRAFERAIEVCRATKESELLKRFEDKTLTELKGIGKGIESIIHAYLTTGTSPEYAELKAQIPEGLLELTKIAGLGPKKAKAIIDQLGIHTLGELEYACKENRLLTLKGFGEKMQTQVLNEIQFLKSNAQFMRLGDIDPLVTTCSEEFTTKFPELDHSWVGEIGRSLEVIASIEILVSPPSDAATAWLKQYFKTIRLPIKIHSCKPHEFGSESVKLSSTPEHFAAYKKTTVAATEAAFYQNQGLSLIPPECRETAESIDYFRQGGEVVNEQDLISIFHNHTVYSDGSGTVEEMCAGAAKLGYKIFGISDHSQSSFYANGLKPDRLEIQKKEIEKARKKFPNLTILWGIECDILDDGSLDYTDKILSSMDFVIGSIHQRFKMDKAAMTKRILTAMDSPHLHMIGHLTGRLLLGRKGYELDTDAILKKAAQKKIAIELNANPERLDIDWREGARIRNYGTPIVINPDAHSVHGLSHVRFGVKMARKALIPKKQIINLFSPSETSAWLARSKSTRSK